MRTAWLGLLVLAVGCGTGGDPKPPPPAFSLEAPKPLDLLHGQTARQDVAVTWHNGEPDALELRATVEPAGRGVTARAEPERLEPGAGPAGLFLSASETAASGEYAVTLTAKAARSGTTAQAKVTVRLPRKE